MRGCKLFLFVKLMSWYVALCDSYTRYKYKIMDFYEYVRAYFYGHHDIWIFMPGHSLPLSISNLGNSSYSPWIYDNNRCLLELNIDDDNRDIVKFSWLSAILKVQTIENRDGKGMAVWEQEFNIDDFLEKFSLITAQDIVPTLQTIFLTWCAYSKHWFNEECMVEFFVISDDGEEQTLDIYKDNDCLQIKHNKIYIVIDSGDEKSETNLEINRGVVENIIISNQSSPELKPLTETTKNKDD